MRRTLAGFIALFAVGLALAGPAEAQAGDEPCESLVYSELVDCVLANILIPGIVCVADRDSDETYGAECGPQVNPPGIPQYAGHPNPDDPIWEDIRERLDNNDACGIWMAVFLDSFRP